MKKRKQAKAETAKIRKLKWNILAKVYVDGELVGAGSAADINFRSIEEALNELEKIEGGEYANNETVS